MYSENHGFLLDFGLPVGLSNNINKLHVFSGKTLPTKIQCILYYDDATVSKTRLWQISYRF